MSAGSAGLNAAWGIYDEPMPPRAGRPPAPSRSHVWMDVCSQSQGKDRPRGCRKGWWTNRHIDDPQRYFCPACVEAQSRNTDRWVPGAVAEAYKMPEPSRSAEWRAKRAALTAEQAEEARRRRAQLAADKVKALRMYQDGDTISAIAVRTGRAKSTVRGWVANIGAAHRRKWSGV